MTFQKKSFLLFLSFLCLLGLSSESFSADRGNLSQVAPFDYKDLEYPGTVLYLEEQPEVYLQTDTTPYELMAGRQNHLKITLKIVDNQPERGTPTIVGEIVLSFFPRASDLLYGEAFKEISINKKIKKNILFLSHIVVGETSRYGVDESRLTHLYGRASGDQGKGIGTKAMKILFKMLSTLFPENSSLLLDCVKATDSSQNDYRRKFYGKKLGMEEYDLGETYASRRPKPFVRFIYNPKVHQELPFQEELESSHLRVNLEGEVPKHLPAADSSSDAKAQEVEEAKEVEVATQQAVEAVEAEAEEAYPQAEAAPQGCCVIQ